MSIADRIGQHAHLDAPLRALRQHVDGRVCYYVIETIAIQDGQFVQHGSAPNFDGGVVTLCTCKHGMRSGRSVEDWIGMWVAGFTSRRLGQQLVYLMRIGRAFSSQRDLWNSGALSSRTKQKKSACGNPVGDLYEYVEGPPHAPSSYATPCANHSHFANQDWIKDIAYPGRKRRAALLVGDPKATFVWSRPRIEMADLIGRGHRGPVDAVEFFKLLERSKRPPTRGSARHCS